MTLEAGRMTAEGGAAPRGGHRPRRKISCARPVAGDKVRAHPATRIIRSFYIAEGVPFVNPDSNELDGAAPSDFFRAAASHPGRTCARRRATQRPQETIQMNRLASRFRAQPLVLFSVALVL